MFADEEPGDVLSANRIFIVVPPLGRRPRDIDPPAQRPIRAVTERKSRPYRGPDVPLASGPWIVDDEAEARMLPWVTLLLLQSDEARDKSGDRTDTMIVAAIQRNTGRAVLFGVPRSLVGLDTGAGIQLGPDAERALPVRELVHRFPGGRDPGATALKQTISLLLGIRIDYYAMVDLDGFVDVVDALGGDADQVKERIHDEVTRPEWETKPKIDVYQAARTTSAARLRPRVRALAQGVERLHPHGAAALLGALADRLDVGNVLRNWLAHACRADERPPAPTCRSTAPDLVRLAAGVEPRRR